MALTEKLTAIADAIRSMNGKTDGLTLDQMPAEILNMDSLNFTVVGGTTQPSDAVENTIWVNTDTIISEYVFSATQPASPAEGMVWFCVGYHSPAAFSVVKDDPIMVYPISTKQYISSKWVSKTSKIHQNGDWVSWITYLFDDGNKFTDLTGGWVGSYTCDPGQYGFSTTPGYIEDGSIVLEGDSGSRLAGVMGTSKSVDLTPYNTLYFEGYTSSVVNSTGLTLGVSTSKNVSDEVAGTITTKTGSFKKSISVKSLTGKYYIFAYTGFASECIGSVKRIWLE